MKTQVVMTLEERQVARLIGLLLHLSHGRAFVEHPLGGTAIAPFFLPPSWARAPEEVSRN